jgi:sensor histidine kinase YesM
LRTPSLEKRIFQWYSLLISVIIALVLVLGNAYLYRSMNERIAYSQEVLLEKNINQLSGELDRMNIVTQQVLFSKTIGELFARSASGNVAQNYYERNFPEGVRLQNDLLMILGLDVSNSIVNLFNENAFLSTNPLSTDWGVVRSSAQNGAVRSVKEALRADPYKAVLQAPIGAYWSSTGSPKEYFAFSRSFFYSTTGKTIGYVQVLRPMSVLENLCSTQDGNTTILILDGQDRIIAPEKLSEPLIRDALELKDAYRAGEVTGVTRLSAEGGAYLVGLKSTRKFGYSMMIIQSVNWNSIWMACLAFIAISAMLLLLSLQMNRMVSRSLTRPLSHITESLHNVTWDNLEMNLVLDKDNTDLQTLQQAFDAMLVRIRESMNLVMESRLHEREAYHMALQSQISPHFLYNMIGNISAIAYDHGVDKIVEICSLMSDMLRYATRFTTEHSTFEQELNYTRSYMELMKIRYEERFSFMVETDSRVLNCRVPRLMLQTIVENCFSHAFPDAQPPYTVAISTFVEEGYWICEVIDNGTGLDEQKLQEIAEKSETLYRDVISGISQLELGGLGILNSLTRLRLIYHNQVRFEAQSMYHGSIIRFGGEIDAGAN